MMFKAALPANLLATLRLVRTRLTLSGITDRSEPFARAQTAAALLRLEGEARSPRRVLVFSLRGGWYPHAAWEALIARGLDLRGAAVHVFNCGGRMPICEVNFRHADPRLACAECSSYPTALVAQFGLTRSWLREYVTLAEAAEIQRQVTRLIPAEFEGWVFDGQPIGQLVRGSVLWFLRKSTIDPVADQAVYRDFLGAGAQIARLAPRLIAATSPDLIVELNGLFFAEQILNTCAPPQCRVVTYEAGWRSNSLGFDDFSPRGFADVDAAWEARRDRDLSPDESSRLDAWIRSRGGGDMQRDFYVRFDRRATGNPLAELGLDPARPTAVLFTNLVWDTAVLGRDLAFASLQDWINRTVETFRANPSIQLVIRIHPAEDLRPSQESNEKVSDVLGALDLPVNVRVVPSRDPLSSYRLIEAAAAVLVYTSTAGLEAALRGRPVVVAARVYYAGRGFTLDVQTGADYPALLDRALASGVLDSTSLDRARRFANLLLFSFLHDIPVVKQRPGTLPLLQAADVPQMRPGSGTEFDWLLERMLEGEALVRP